MKASRRNFTAEELTRASFNASVKDIQQQDDVIPPGFYSSDEWGDLLKKGRATIWKDIKNLLKSGKMESKRFKRRDVAGRMQCHAFYRLT